MVKTIRKTIQITTRKRHDGVRINEEFYSYDKNNAQFEFIMDYDIPAEKVIALFHFENSNRYYETLCQFKGNLITIEFDTSLIVEDELVTGYLYFDKLEKSTDVYRFTFGARLSEIDKTRELPVQEKVSRRIVPVADIVTKQELEELMDKIKKNGGTYNDTEIRSSISSIKESIETLKQNDDSIGHIIRSILSNFLKFATNNALNQVEQRVEQLETNSATKEKAEAVESRVLALENKPSVIPQAYDDSALRGRVSALEAKEDRDTVYNDEEVKRRLTTLEGKTDNFISGVSVNKEGSNVTLTYNYVDGQTKNVSFTDSDTVNVAYDDSGLKARITNLENRPQVDVSNYALKSELYNDTALAQRVSTLENNIVTKQDLQAKDYLTEHQSLTDYAKKSEIPSTSSFATADSVNNLLRTQGEQATKITALEAKSAYEIHGTGMPNGRVTAPVGTTYVDTAVTNGALKWIKQSGDGNTGWKLLTGDTGWRTLNVLNKLGNAKIQIRRINDEVIVKFDGLDWGWFGMKPMSQQGDLVVEKSIGAKRYTWVKVDVGRGNQVIPEGFRSSSSILGGLYGDLGDLLGSVYVGGKDDSNALQLRYAMPRNEVTDTILSQIRISPITFTTDDDYPTTLP